MIERSETEGVSPRTEDVTAAIEGPTARWVDPQPDSGPHKPAMPGHWVIERSETSAAIERLRHNLNSAHFGKGPMDWADVRTLLTEVERLVEDSRTGQMMHGLWQKSAEQAEAEVERLRHALFESNLDRDMNFKEVERLRAVIEDQHSDETRNRLEDAIAAYGDARETVYMHASGVMSPGIDQTIDAVLSVLSGSESVGSVRAERDEADR